MNVFMSVSLLTGLCENYSTNLNKIRWRGGTWATKETIGF